MAKTRVGLSAADISNKWGNKLKGAVGDIQRGIDNVTENPAEKAIEAIPRMVAGVQQAAADGRIEAGLRQVNLNDWKTKTKEKVAQRLAGGVDAAMPKRRQFDQYLVQTLDSVLPSVAAMPKMTIEDGLNRVRAVVMHMHDNPYKQNR